MQEIGIEIVGSQVREGAGKGLLHLIGKRCPGVVGQAVVLAILVGELALQEELAAGQARCVKRFADAGFVVMLALIRGVDRTKARAQGQGHEIGRALFFPGGAIQEGR